MVASELCGVFRSLMVCVGASWWILGMNEVGYECGGFCKSRGKGWLVDPLSVCLCDLVHF